MTSSFSHFSKHQRKQYTHFRIFSFMYYFFNAMVMVFQPLYFVEIGIPIYAIFLNAALAAFLSLFIENQWSKWSDKGHKKQFIALGNASLIITAIMIFFTHDFWMMIAITLVRGFTPNSDTLVTVMVYELSEAGENLHNYNEVDRNYHKINSFARFRKFGSIGWAICLPLIGLLLNITGLGINFFIAAGGLTVLTVYFYIAVDEINNDNKSSDELSLNETPPRKVTQKTNENSALVSIRRILKNPLYLGFMICAFMFNSSRSVYFQVQGLFYNLFAQDNYFLLAWIYSIAAFAEWPTMNIIAKSVRKWSWEKMVIISYISTGIRMITVLLLIILQGNIFWGYLIQISTGIILGIRLPSETFGIHTILKKNERTVGQSFNNTIRVMGALVGNLIGSLFAYILSNEEQIYLGIFIFAAILAFASGITFIFFIRRRMKRGNS